MRGLSRHRIAVIGLGYVGLPLAVEFGKKYRTVGFDTNPTRIKEIKSSTVFIVTVPTPIDQYKRPNLTPLLKASETVGRILKKGDIVIYESTVYPGCTEEICIPAL